MSLKIGTNISSLFAQRQVDAAGSAVSKSFQRLSSGLRINNASDDAAGLAIGTALRADSKIFSQAIRNVNDGISAFNISEGALTELANITTRQKELAEQAANGTYSLAQRRSLNAEANALTDEFNRIVQTTSFNGIKLLDNTTTSLSLQAGSGTANTLSVALNKALERIVGDGTFQATASFAAGAAPEDVISADINHDGKLDLVIGNQSSTGTLSVLLGNGDGTFKARSSYITGIDPQNLSFADFNGDGHLDIVSSDIWRGTTSVFLGNGDGAFKARISFTVGATPYSNTVGDVDKDGRLDIISIEYSSSTVSILSGNGDGTFKARNILTSSANPFEVTAADLNGDGNIDIISGGTGWADIFLGNGDGTFKAKKSSAIGTVPYTIEAYDVNRDGIFDLITGDSNNSEISVLFGNGDGSFQARRKYQEANYGFNLADLNGDGLVDIVAPNSAGSVGVLLGNGDGSFSARTDVSTGASLAIRTTVGDFNGDGISDVATNDWTNGKVVILSGNTRRITSAQYLNLFTQAGAQSALNILDGQLNRVTSELGNLGAAQSRLDVTVSNLQASRENYESAYSRIMDADIAAETTELVRNQILQQAGVAILAQANQQPGLVLRLLS